MFGATESQRYCNTAARWSMALSIAAIIIASCSAYFVRLSARAQLAAVQPILVCRGLVLEYDKRNVKIGVRVENLGKSIAVVESVRIYLHQEDQTPLWVTIMEGNLVAPGKTRYDSVLRTRHLEEYSLDVVDVIKARGLRIQLSYRSDQLPRETYSSDLVFPNAQWKYKLLGVRPDK